ncbi:MAG: glutamyl-tRNA reductase [Chloroflexi bacterium]|nr:glutamyl-tRNA reductase [Chloroflexota bacterium]
MRVVVIGLDHHNTPVELRESLAFPPEKREQALRQLAGAATGGNPQLPTEAIILSTCNRVEIYALVHNTETAYDDLTRFLAAIHHVAVTTIKPRMYALEGRDAVAHLCAVAAGTKSLIIGEPQIQGQVKEAFEAAQTSGTAGPVLSALCRTALRAGKRARTETAISQHAVSVSHAAVELARKIFDDLSPLHVLLVGSGEMSRLAAKTLLEQGARDLTVVNRSLDHAREMAAPFNGCALSFDEFEESLKHSDIVISSTSAPEPIIRADLVRAAMKARQHRPLFVIDIAVPRDVDPAVGKLENVFLFDIDNLKDVTEANLEQRRKELGKVEAIVEEETQQFMRWLDTLAVSPTIADLHHRAEEIRRAEVDKALRRMGTLSERERNIVESLSKGIVNKLLHRPTVRLKAEATSGNGIVYSATLRELFGLVGEEE